MSKKYRIPAALCMAALWIFLIYRFTGIFFETNDDRIISEIFSGAMTGVPEAHTYYVDYTLGFLLSSLYRITTAIPWYGGMLVLFQFLCCFFIADAFLSRCRNKKALLFALSFIALTYAAEIYVIASIQYTSTAAMLAITGYLCFLLYPGEKSRCVSFFLLESLSFLLRSNAMLMIQPMGFLVLLGLHLSENSLFPFSAPSYKRRSGMPSFSSRKTHSVIQPASVSKTDAAISATAHHNPIFGKKQFTKYPLLFQAIVILSAILLSGKSSYLIFHSSPGWKEYKKVNDAVTEITDYAAIPDYADVKDILPKYNVTEKQYRAFLQYAMIEENLSGDCLSEIADVAHAQNTKPALSQTIRQFLESYTTREYWDLNFLLLASWSALILCLFLKRAFSLLLPLTGLLLGRSALWLFLLYEGRIPPRVMVPLFLGEITFLFCLFFLNVLKNDKFCSAENVGLSANTRYDDHVIKKHLPVLLVLLLLPFGAKTLKNQYLYLSEKNASEAIYFRGMQEMITYCNSHPENRYFIDASTLIYYRGSAFETKIYGPRNAVITGCWYSGAPVLYEYEKNYFAGCGSIYLLTSSDMEMQSRMVIDYLEERLDTTARPDDTFTVSNGGKYLVYVFPL